MAQDQVVNEGVDGDDDVILQIIYTSLPVYIYSNCSNILQESFFQDIDVLQSQGIVRCLCATLRNIFML